MPSVMIEVRKQYSQDEEIALMEAVHKSLRDAFKLRPVDLNVRLIVHEPHRFMCPPDRQRPEFYTHVIIDAFSGRSIDAKRTLYRSIVENLEVCGIPKDHVKIILREIPWENWGIRGGQAGCDLDFEFEVGV